MWSHCSVSENQKFCHCTGQPTEMEKYVISKLKQPLIYYSYDCMYFSGDKNTIIISAIISIALHFSVLNKNQMEDVRFITHSGLQCILQEQRFDMDPVNLECNYTKFLL